jgi:hypothetical protein
VLRVDGTCGEASGEFLIAVGKAAQDKHRFSVGMEVCGLSNPVPDPRIETAGFYKTSGLKVLKVPTNEPSSGPPFLGVPPDLETSTVGGIDAWTFEPMNPSVQPAFGVAACRWR